MKIKLVSAALFLNIYFLPIISAVPAMVDQGGPSFLVIGENPTKRKARRLQAAVHKKDVAQVKELVEHVNPNEQVSGCSAMRVALGQLIRAGQEGFPADKGYERLPAVFEALIVRGGANLSERVQVKNEPYTMGSVMSALVWRKPKAVPVKKTLLNPRTILTNCLVSKNQKLNKIHHKNLVENLVCTKLPPELICLIAHYQCYLNDHEIELLKTIKHSI